MKHFDILSKVQKNTENVDSKILKTKRYINVIIKMCCTW